MGIQPIPNDVERIAKLTLDCCFRVHTTLGPGLLERVYEACLCHELKKSAVPHQRQLSLPINYDGLRIDDGFFIDVLVADSVLVELKAVEAIHPRHEAQLMTYLRLSKKRLGFLINFNVPRSKTASCVA